MKKMVLVALAIVGLNAWSEGYDNAKSCIMTYVKHDRRQPNLFIACDGGVVLTHTVATEGELEKPEEFRAALYQAFQQIVNTNGAKDCREQNYDWLWYATCYLK